MPSSRAEQRGEGGTRARWEAILGGSDAARTLAANLVVEGLDPSDTASLTEITPQLLEALGLDDGVTRDRILAHVHGSSNARMPASPAAASSAYTAAVGAAAPLVAKQSMYSTRGQAVAGAGLGAFRTADEDDVPGFGPFRRRAFQSTDRRGVEAQEVVPGLFLGGFGAAQNVKEQRANGITHIVNATSRQVVAPGAHVMTLGLRDNDGDQDISRFFFAGQRIHRRGSSGKRCGSCPLHPRRLTQQHPCLCLRACTKRPQRAGYYCGHDTSQTRGETAAWLHETAASFSSGTAQRERCLSRSGKRADLRASYNYSHPRWCGWRQH